MIYSAFNNDSIERTLLNTPVWNTFIYINNVIQSASTYSYVASTGIITFTTAPTSGATVSVELGDWDRELGSYQFIKLNDVVNNFIIS